MTDSATIEARKPKVTINDIARVCGVSKVTVSYVMNSREGYVKISDRTKERVRAAAKELGYHPNALARGLANQRTDMLALVMQYANAFTGGSAFVTELMHTAMNSASKFGFDLMLQTKCRDTLSEQIAAIVDGRADGALLLRDARDPIANELLKRGFPAVYIFSHSEDPSISSIDCDNVSGGRMATEYLIGLGHKAIGHIGGNDSAAPAHDRYAGHVQAMRDASLPVNPDWKFTATHAASDFSMFEAAMRQPVRPTALFCWSDDVAAVAMNILQTRIGLRVPEDVSIIGFDSTPFCEHTTPRLTSIRQPFEQISDAAFETLCEQIANKNATVRTMRLEPRLDERDSCRATRH